MDTRPAQQGFRRLAGGRAFVVAELRDCGYGGGSLVLAAQADDEFATILPPAVRTSTDLRA